MSSPALDVPIRDRKQAALDIAIEALEWIEWRGRGGNAPEAAKNALNRIAELIREPE